MFTEPTWLRLGFNEPPDLDSGKGIGIIIIDDIIPHPALNHLAKRLKHVIVQDDHSVVCRDLTQIEYGHEAAEPDSHGLMSVLALAHRPLNVDGLYHIGIASAGNFIVLSHGAFKEGEGDRLEKGVDWILKNLPEFNPRVILTMGWHALDNPTILQKTENNTTVQALRGALRQGVLVVCANGNSDIASNHPPKEYLAVGGFNDRGSSKPSNRAPYHGELFGFNGDGDFRPDIRAPRTRVPIPYNEEGSIEGKLSFYSGTSASSTLIAGVCMHLLAKFPSLSNQALKNVLVHYGDPLVGDMNKACCVNVRQSIGAIIRGNQDAHINNRYKDILPATKRHLELPRDIEQALEFSKFIQEIKYSRDHLWIYGKDLNPMIRKMAAHSLGPPFNEQERNKYWSYFQDEPEDGVRTWYLYGLLQEPKIEEANWWMQLADNPHWSIRWCASEYLKNYPDLHQLEMTADPELVALKAGPVLDFLKSKL